MPRTQLSLHTFLVVALGFFSGGCAYLTTFKASTDLPSTTTSGAATAVHIDAKQRVVLAKAGFACAEPSPDALSAYASSMGLGIALPNQASASFAQALQESSASIGLRTQAITLMRDALYRICEASYNERLNQPQVMSLLARTQDLTLAVLAVEQLTGAVTAQQVALGGSANAAASASLSTNQQLLQVAKDNEATLKAKQQHTETKEAEKRKEITERQKRIDQLPALITPATGQPPSADDKAKLEAELKEKQTAQATATRELEMLVEQTKAAKEQARQATETREAIEKNYGVALTQAHAAASGFGQFSGPNPPTVKLNDQSTQYIAKAVQEIVKTVVNRSHLEESCLALISSEWKQRIADLRSRIQGTTETDGAKSQMERELKVALETEAFCLDVFAKLIAERK
jgi:hypothetical protein